MKILIVLLCAMLLLALVAGFHKRRLELRTRLLGEILDLADAAERDLHECRERLREVPPLVATLSGSSEISARATLTAEPEVQAALRDLLAHRLWLKAHAGDAELRELRSARDALRQSRSALSGQLQHLAEVCVELERARESNLSNAGTGS
ncbi:MAG TPA: hypothetical protein VFG55_02090 [Rhodanobacteraceae bacterium]|nr:hypothetical protein [Rhodanobacteraceae bacterium]